MLTDRISSQDLEALQAWGWRLDGDQLVGKYQTDHGSWDGIIGQEHGSWQFYILDCPRQILIGNRASCFKTRPHIDGRTVHWIHFHTSDPEPISGIPAIIRVIEEAMIESPANAADE